MKESKFQPGDLVRHVSYYVEGALLLVELSGELGDFDYTWHALGPRGICLVWESNLTLISRGSDRAPAQGAPPGPSNKGLPGPLSGPPCILTGDPPGGGV